MGDAGVALSGDANSIHYNASRMMFTKQRLSQRLQRMILARRRRRRLRRRLTTRAPYVNRWTLLVEP